MNDLSWNLLCQMRNEGLSYREIGKIYGITGSAVHLWFRRKAVPKTRTGLAYGIKKLERLNIHLDSEDIIRIKEISKNKDEFLYNTVIRLLRKGLNVELGIE
jgi:transposase